MTMKFSFYEDFLLEIQFLKPGKYLDFSFLKQFWKLVFFNKFVRHSL